MVVKIWRIHVLKYCHFSPISAGWTVHGQSSLNQPAKFENIGAPNLSKHRPSLLRSTAPLAHRVLRLEIGVRN